MTTPLPPGWYPHPDGGPDKLYWDGREWYSAPLPHAPDPNHSMNRPSTVPFWDGFSQAAERPSGRKALIWSGAILLVLVLALVSQTSNGDRDRPQSSPSTTSPPLKPSNSPDAQMPQWGTTGRSATEPPPPPPPPPPAATPNYSVVGTDERYDNKPIFYAAIEPVDLSNDSFKERVKLVVQAMATGEGSPDFSAWIFDDETVARTAFSRDTDPPRFPSPEEGRAERDVRGQHLTAIYSGGNPNTLYPYELNWYPGAFTGTANVGKWVGHEEWKP